MPVLSRRSLASALGLSTVFFEPVVAPDPPSAPPPGASQSPDDDDEDDDKKDQKEGNCPVFYPEKPGCLAKLWSTGCLGEKALNGVPNQCMSDRAQSPIQLDLQELKKSPSPIGGQKLIYAFNAPRPIIPGRV